MIQNINYIGTVLRARRNEEAPWGILSGSDRYGQRTLIEPKMGGEYTIYEFQNHGWETRQLDAADMLVLEDESVKQALHLVATGFQHVPAVKTGVHAMYTKMPWLREQFIGENFQTANS